MIKRYLRWIQNGAPPHPPAQGTLSLWNPIVCKKGHQLLQPVPLFQSIGDTLVLIGLKELIVELHASARFQIVIAVTELAGLKDLVIIHKAV